MNELRICQDVRTNKIMMPRMLTCPLDGVYAKKVSRVNGRAERAQLEESSLNVNKSAEQGEMERRNINVHS